MAVCPHIDGMRVDDLVQFCRDQKIDSYLPNETRGNKAPHYDRDYLLTVIYLISIILFRIDSKHPQKQRVS